MTEFDELAEHYDTTRGGERRGEEYASSVDALLPPGEGPILEVGTGTGVVALGLRRRGRPVVGLDLSQPMLRRAHWRLGHSVVLSDALRMAVASGSVAHAFSVWVVHSVADPVRLFEEVGRVLRPHGRYVVTSTQRPAPDDEAGRIIEDMSRRIDEARGASRPRGVTTDEVLAWAETAGCVGVAHTVERRWRSSPGDELAAIAHRSWPAMRELSAAALAEVTRPVIAALEALPPGETTRRAFADLVVLEPAARS